MNVSNLVSPVDECVTENDKVTMNPITLNSSPMFSVLKYHIRRKLKAFKFCELLRESIVHKRVSSPSGERG